MRRAILVSTALFLSGLWLQVAGREVPLTQFKVVKIIEVDVFPGDDDQKIARAVATIPNDGAPVEVRFAKREYRLKTDKPLFRLSGKRNLVINGNGCNFIFGHLRGTVCDLSDCQNVIIKDYSVDYDPLHFSQGVVMDVDKETRSFTVRKDEGYPDFTVAYFGDAALTGDFLDRIYAVLRDKDRSGAHKRGSLNCYGMLDVTEEGDGVFRVTCPMAMRDVEPGDIWVIAAHRMMGSPLHNFSGGRQITLMDVTMYGGCVGVIGMDVDCLNLFRVDALVKPGSNRLITLARDGYLLHHFRVGPWIEKCQVERIGDDGINFHTNGFAIRQGSLEGKRTVTFVERSFGSGTKRARVSKGDTLLIYDTKAGVEVQRVVVRSTDESSTGRRIKCILGRPLLASIDTSVPEVESRYAVFNMSYTYDGFVIRDCRFTDVRRYPLFLVHGNNGIVENCLVERSAANAMYSGIEYFRSVGYGLVNTRVTGNTFIDCYVCREASAGPGWIAASMGDGRKPDVVSRESYMRDLTFENNVFREVRSPVFYISNTENCIVRGNTFYPVTGYLPVAEELIKWGTANINPQYRDNQVVKL